MYYTGKVWDILLNQPTSQVRSSLLDLNISAKEPCTTMSDQPEDAAAVSTGTGTHQPQDWEPSLSRSSRSRIWHSQETWLIEQRQYKARLEKEGIKGIELFEAMTTRNLEHKLQTKAQNRCPSCWHVTTRSSAVATSCSASTTISLDSPTTSPPKETQKNQSLVVVDHCICDQLEPLVMRTTVRASPSLTTSKSTLTSSTDHHNNLLPNNVKLLILMHQKEWMCGGNSAKLLLQLLPDHCELFLFGRLGEVDRLFRRMVTMVKKTKNDGNINSCNKYSDGIENSDPMSHTMILWPSPEACSVTDFLQQHQQHHNNHQQKQQQQQQQQQKRRSPNNNKNNSQMDCSTSPAVDDYNNSRTRHESSSTNTIDQEEILKVVVLDGTYTQARNMRKSLRKRIKKGQVPLATRSSSTSHEDENEKKSRIHQITRMPQDVMIRPVTDSIFHRAQKNYGQAHQQRSSKSSSISSSSTTSSSTTMTKPRRNEIIRSDDDSCVSQIGVNDHSSPSSSTPLPLPPDDQSDIPSSMTEVARRVSTAEACGMLLVELGADVSVQERILDAIKINNQSLATARAR